MTNITAKITARGAGTCVPDRSDSVDADIYLDGELLGSVTLLESPATGSLDTWGSPDHWAEDGVLDFLSHGGEHWPLDRDRVGGVVEAVRTACS